MRININAGCREGRDIRELPAGASPATDAVPLRSCHRDEREDQRPLRVPRAPRARQVRLPSNCSSNVLYCTVLLPLLPPPTHSRCIAPGSSSRRIRAARAATSCTRCSFTAAIITAATTSCTSTLEATAGCDLVCIFSNSFVSFAFPTHREKRAFVCT